jgi:hypothetical protein
MNNTNVASNRIKNIKIIIGFEVFMAVINKTVVFSVVTLCRFVGGYLHFRGHITFTLTVEVCRFRSRLGYTGKLQAQGITRGTWSKQMRTNGQKIAL